jgi:hypothetical protein
MTSVRLTDKPVNSKQFLSQAEDDIREDELFFYKYFTSTARHHKVTEDKSLSDIEGFEDLKVYDPEVASVDFAKWTLLSMILALYCIETAMLCIGL